MPKAHSNPDVRRQGWLWYGRFRRLIHDPARVDRPKRSEIVSADAASASRRPPTVVNGHGVSRRTAELGHERTSCRVFRRETMPTPFKGITKLDIRDWKPDCDAFVA